ncbi:hypothetical protein [Oenococcus kitaharae]|uniref:Oligosaccharide repeat unit polymerase Wzy n=1 Tax=Oenococcus kitaharae DSM 17330 TaxID=1045004 RepID=G9WIQ4_9LACO|nr:hypothetical protein [Oenococcus kitaharae]EHN58193.1 oligosaccharide repeat unit polymerase Wzy [Oenococcus kitaharae DSM 17330]OEY81615.1 hypothetical protein NT95_09005 [Oenococcus kitaharae]OEY83100.1 hypothetical protein NV75_07105 [Oenococcus kitaharae]OEY84354.1 hypothetical protein NT96_03530 [Oenococcus kitaharae]
MLSKVEDDVRTIDFQVILILFLLVLLALSTLNGLFSNLDEVAGILALVINTLYFIVGKLKRISLTVMLLLTTFFSAGLASNFFSGVERTSIEIIIDALIIAKPFLIFSAVYQLANSNTLVQLKRLLGSAIKIFLLIALFFCLLNQLRIVDMSEATNNSFRNFEFFFGFPVSFAILVLALFGIIMDTRKYIYKQPFFWICTILVVSSLKTQSLFFITVFVLLLALTRQKPTQISLRTIIIILFFSLLTALPSIINYFHTSFYSPRQVLMTGSIDLFRQYFPFGAGFATFGSPMAAQNYSPIYMNLGYNTLYGMGLGGDKSFLSDNFFAELIGQFGFIGILIFLALAINVVKTFRISQLNKNLNCYCISMFISLLAINISSSFFSSAPGALMMCVLAILSKSTTVK